MVRLRLTPEQEAALDDLNGALLVIAHNGTPAPCTTSDAWLSPDRDDRAAAVAGCAPCPVLDLCAKAADAIQPDAGVWGGQDWNTVGFERAVS